MLKQILTGVALIFVGLLPSVRGDEELSGSHSSDDSLPNLIVDFKGNCAEYQNTFPCLDWDSSELIDLQPANFFKSGPAGEAEEGQGKHSGETLSDSADRPVHKRFLAARRRNPTARGYKRGPGFRSWGGKRDSMANRQDKRTKFGPWGGKRSDGYFWDGLPTEKKAKFQNWGGKRTFDDSAETPKFLDVSIKRGFVWKDKGFYESEPSKKAVPKRPQFQSWGGKRTLYPWRKIFGFLNDQSPGYAVIGGEKRKFSSWGGKRFENVDGHVIRQGFHNRQSKRASSEADSPAEGALTPKNPAGPHDGIQPDWKNADFSFSSGTCQEQEEEENNKR